jgi:hypothetical protein
MLRLSWLRLDPPDEILGLHRRIPLPVAAMQSDVAVQVADLYAGKATGLKLGHFRRT